MPVHHKHRGIRGLLHGVTFQQISQYRPDLLSYDLYGSVAYWWIFLARNINVIRDPIWDMVAGMAIYVPTASRIQTLIG
jgi:hypothetical protein